MNIRIDDNDNNLIILLQNSDKQAFKLLFEKYGHRLYHFSLKYLKEKEDAEDVLNEVFLKIWENRQNIRTNTSFQSYLFTIAYNNIRQRFLKRSREEKYIQVFADEYFSELSNNENQPDYHLFAKKIIELIDHLPPRRKEIFILSYKEELKNEKIAEQLQLSIPFVKNQLSIARKFILGKIKEDNQLSGVLFFYLFAGKNSN